MGLSHSGGLWTHCWCYRVSGSSLKLILLMFTFADPTVTCDNMPVFSVFYEKVSEVTV